MSIVFLSVLLTDIFGESLASNSEECIKCVYL